MFACFLFQDMEMESLLVVVGWSIGGRSVGWLCSAPVCGVCICGLVGVCVCVRLGLVVWFVVVACWLLVGPRRACVRCVSPVCVLFLLRLQCLCSSRLLPSLADERHVVDISC